jgi:hypothetical protein
MKETILPPRQLAIASIRAVIFTCFLCVVTPQSKAQCFASSTVSGTTAVNDASIGSLAFNNTNNAFTSDNNRANATALAVLFSGSTNYLKVTGFGFSIPSYASICGIEIQVEKRATGLNILSWVRDNDIRIVKNNAVTGDDLGDDATDWSTTESTFTYGSTNNLWGTTLTPAEVNASNFGIAISAQMTGLLAALPSAQIDNIRMTVYYNPILPVKLLFFNSGLKNNLAKLEWETADEEDNEYITLQRSITGQSQWTDLSRFNMQTGNQGKKYSYTDPLVTTGNYSYRLMITHKDHQHTFSEIKQVIYRSTGSPVLYPNPARDCITLDNLDDTRTISVTNLSQQQLNAPVLVTGENGVRIDISRLPRGIYFIGAGTHKLKFFKE